MRLTEATEVVANWAAIWALVGAASVSAKVVTEAAAAVAARWWHIAWRTWASGKGWVTAEHGNARAVLRAAKGHHVLADLSCNDLATLRVGVGKDVLNKVVAELVSRDVDERHTRAVWTSLAHAVKVTVEEVVSADLQALLNNLGGELGKSSASFSSQEHHKRMHTEFHASL